MSTGATNTGMKDGLGRPIFRGPKGGVYVITASGKHGKPAKGSPAALRKQAAARKRALLPPTIEQTRFATERLAQYNSALKRLAAKTAKTLSGTGKRHLTFQLLLQRTRATSGEPVRATAGGKSLYAYLDRSTARPKATWSLADDNDWELDQDAAGRLYSLGRPVIVA